MSGFNATIVPGGGSNWYNEALHASEPERQVSTKVPVLPGDPQQARLGTGIRAVGDGATALVKNLGLKVDALATSVIAVEAFVAAFQSAVAVEFTHMRSALGVVFQRDFSAGHTFTMAMRTALASYVAADRAGLSGGLEATAYVGRCVAIMAIDLFPAEDIAIRVAAIAAASAIVAKVSLGDVEKALEATPAPGSAPLPAGARGLAVAGESPGPVLPPEARELPAPKRVSR